MKRRKAVDRLRARFGDTWMADAGFVHDLDKTVRERQRHLLRKEASRRRLEPPRNQDAFAPFGVQLLVDELRRAVADVEAAGSGLRVSIACALLGELIATALCEREDLAGDTYPKIAQTNEPEWFAVHYPISLLRNALFHPGAIRPPPEAQGTDFGSHVHLVVRILERGTVRDRGSDFRSLAASLRRSPANIATEEMALWAVLQLDALGEHDARRVGLRRRSASPSSPRKGAGRR